MGSGAINNQPRGGASLRIPAPLGGCGQCLKYVKSYLRYPPETSYDGSKPRPAW